MRKCPFHISIEVENIVLSADEKRRTESTAVVALVQRPESQRSIPGVCPRGFCFWGFDFGLPYWAGQARRTGSSVPRTDPRLPHVQMEILKAHGVVAIHRALKLQGKDQIQIAAATRHERTARLRRISLIILRLGSFECNGPSMRMPFMSRQVCDSFLSPKLPEREHRG